MRLRIHRTLKQEICHFADPSLTITSQYNRVLVQTSDQQYEVRLPEDAIWKRLTSISRLARRALRLDKCNVLPLDQDLVLIRQGWVYHYSGNNQRLTTTMQLSNCRNVLHQSIAVRNNKQVYFGEYGHNPTRQPVPVYRSTDSGKSWETVFTFEKGLTKHVHGCFHDPFEDKIWVLTGDYDGECHMVCADPDFNEVEWIGDGRQVYRACKLHFEADAVHWIMDSHLQVSHHVKLDRKTRAVEIGQPFPGPVWYSKRLTDGYYLAATAQEIGPGVLDRYVHLMVSRDLKTWDEVHRFEHDGLPKRYFKFGVLGFAEGEQDSRSFMIFGEAIKGLDGKVAICELVP